MQISRTKCNKKNLMHGYNILYLAYGIKDFYKKMSIIFINEFIEKNYIKNRFHLSTLNKYKAFHQIYFLVPLGVV